MNVTPRVLETDRGRLAVAGSVAVLSSVKIAAGLALAAVHAFGPSGRDAAISTLPPWLLLVSLVVWGGAGGILVLGSRREPRAAFLGSTYLAFSAAFADPFLLSGTVREPRLVPAIAELLASMPPVAFAPLCLWWFASAFPAVHRARRGRRRTAVALLCAACGLALFALNLVPALARVAGDDRLERAARFASRLESTGGFWILVCSLCILALVSIALTARRADPIERRRVRLFVAGLVLGATPVCLEILLEALVPPFGRFMNRPGARLIGAAFVYPLILSIPITTAHAVLVQRVLELRWIVRRAVRWTLARTTVVLAGLAPAVAVIAYGIVHRNRTLSDLLSGRGLALLALAGGIVALGLGYRGRILDAIDRRFYREHHDARVLLTRLARRVRSVASAEELAGLLVAEIDRALHPVTLAVLVLDESRRSLVAPGQGVPSLRTDSVLVRRVSGRPGRFRASLARGTAPEVPELTDAERVWLDHGGFVLLIPMTATDDTALGLIALGERRSESPWTREDRDLLDAIAEAGALVLEHRRSRSPHETPRRLSGDREEAARECLDCGAVWPGGSGPCPSCSGATQTAGVPFELSGKFRFEAVIGEGGMGRVYRARDLVLERSVAIKTLPRLSEPMARRLRREARTMASVSHPNLALILGAETWKRTPLLVLEYLGGGTLAGRLRSGPLDVDACIEIGIRIAHALETLHADGMVHRDVKPANIGFTVAGEAKLLDFGLARILVEGHGASDSNPEPDPSALRDTVTEATLTRTAVTSAGRLVGTPLYLSPEVLRTGRADPSADLWSLAVTLYESVAGRHPFRSATVRETLDRIVTESAPDVRIWRPDCPALLAALFLDALSQDPRRRPATAHKLAARLQAVRFGAAVG